MQFFVAKALPRAGAFNSTSARAGPGGTAQTSAQTRGLPRPPAPPLLRPGCVTITLNAAAGNHARPAGSFCAAVALQVGRSGQGRAIGNPGEARSRTALLGLSAGAWPSADRGCAGRGENHAGPVAGARGGLRLPPPAVH